MHGCSVVHGVAGSVLLLVLGFSGCGPGKPAQTPTDPVATGGGETDMDPTDGAEPTGETGDTGETTDTGGSGADVETRNTDRIQKVIVDNRKPFRDCYEKLKKEIPTLAGTMTLTFTLDAEGKVMSAELNQDRSDLKAPDVVKCAIAELQKLKFPPSSRGMETTVNYPFNFKP